MVLGKLPVPGRPTILITVGQGPIATGEPVLNEHANDRIRSLSMSDDI